MPDLSLELQSGAVRCDVSEADVEVQLPPRVQVVWKGQENETLRPDRRAPIDYATSTRNHFEMKVGVPSSRGTERQKTNEKCTALKH